jgi:hypothetical protein
MSDDEKIRQLRYKEINRKIRSIFPTSNESSMQYEIDNLETERDALQARVAELEASAVVPECAACVSPELHYETQRGLSCKSDTQSAVVPSGVWQFYQDGEWHTGMNNIRHRADTEAAGYKVRDFWVNQEQDPFN